MFGTYLIDIVVAFTWRICAFSSGPFHFDQCFDGRSRMGLFAGAASVTMLFGVGSGNVDGRGVVEDITSLSPLL